MQQASDQTCVIAGCDRERHSIEGRMMAFCAPHYFGKGNMKRRGLPSIHMPMIRVLIAIKSAIDTGSAYAEIPIGTIASKTITCLLQRRYIRRDPVVKDAYVITRKGLTTLAIYTSPMFRRTDGICADCGVNPRETPGKRTGIYCRECINRRNRERLAAKRPKVDTTLCMDCQDAPRHATKNKLYPRCKACILEHTRATNQMRYDRFVERLTAGEHIPCMKCENLRHSVPGIVYSYCYNHLKEIHTASKARAKSKAA